MADKKEKKVSNKIYYIIIFGIAFMASALFAGFFISRNTGGVISFIHELMGEKNTGEVYAVSSAESPVSGAGMEPAIPYGIVPESSEVPQSYFKDSLFIGDSLTHGMRDYGVMSYNNVIAYSGVRMEAAVDEKLFQNDEGDTFTIAEASRAYAPEQIYIMLGANSISSLEPQSIIDLYRRLVEDLKTAHPESRILIQSILPVTTSYEQIYPDHSNAKIDEVNYLLIDMCKQMGLYYINVQAEFRDTSGGLIQEYTSGDGLHLNPEGYAVWTAYLQSHVVEN
ncbi:MAG: GDSL-type esterase/lipase family protein [Oscillospiraceae bacterium]|nr:GDSL-type esterase/lipase family protein [Oscillospiraceae bacterium]